MRNALAAHRPLAGGEDEFLDLAARAAAGDARAFTLVFTAPPAYAWAVGAFRATSAVLAGRDAKAGASLALQLEGFKALALGQQWLARGDLALRTPLDVRPPFALPGTAWTLFGAPAAIEGLEAGALLVRAGLRTHRLGPGEAAGDHSLRRAPVVEQDGAAIVLSPFPLTAPELDLRGAEQAAAAGLAYHEAKRDLVQRALALVARHAPETWAQLREWVRVIALQPPGASGFLASSSADAPGSFVASAVECPYELANFFVHEFHHNRMFALEALAPVLASGADPELHYSPWRDDPRPLRGLLHALYVHVPVVHFWLAVRAAGDAGAAMLGRASDRAARAALQFEPVLAALARHGRFSERGRAVFDEIARAAREAQAAVRRAGLTGAEVSWEGAPPGASAPGGRPRTVAESVREHARRFGGAKFAPGTGAAPPG